ncbi:MAG: hypothetical protein HQL44_12365 [Alphaproteobacteria bacterium]|nr:hypothetical protein [Alphaproteobacteria bacterium]
MYRTDISRRDAKALIYFVAWFTLSVSWYVHWMIQVGVSVFFLYSIAGRLLPNRNFFLTDERNLFFSFSRRSTMALSVSLIAAIPVAQIESSSNALLTGFDINSIVNSRSLFMILQNLANDPEFLQGNMFLPRSFLFALISSFLLAHYALNARSYVYAPKPRWMLLALVVILPTSLIMFAAGATMRDYLPLALNIVIIHMAISSAMYWLIFPFRSRL